MTLTPAQRRSLTWAGIALVATLLLITYLPWLTTWIPRMALGN